MDEQVTPNSNVDKKYNNIHVPLLSSVVYVHPVTGSERWSKKRKIVRKISSSHDYEWPHSQSYCVRILHTMCRCAWRSHGSHVGQDQEWGSASQESLFRKSAMAAPSLWEVDNWLLCYVYTSESLFSLVSLPIPHSFKEKKEGMCMYIHVCIIIYLHLIVYAVQ